MKNNVSSLKTIGLVSLFATTFASSTVNGFTGTVKKPELAYSSNQPHSSSQNDRHKQNERHKQSASLNQYNAKAGLNQNTLSFDQALKLAIEHDSWLKISQLRERALIDKSVASSSLPDPVVSLNMMSLPTDTWSLDQENMTQLKIGVSQRLNRGNSDELREAQLKIDAAAHPYQRADRVAKVKALVSQLWLDAFLAQQSIQLIEQDRSLFEQLAEQASASYASAFGSARQQDVIQAQLEVTQLQDRLLIFRQQLEMKMAQLSQWLYSSDLVTTEGATQLNSMAVFTNVNGQLPELTMALDKTMSQGLRADMRSALAQRLSTHPAVLAIDSKYQSSKKGIELAQQQYKPQWPINASYGVREDNPMGQERSDLFSVGVSFDVPLFTSNKQDRTVSAARAESEAVKTEKLFLTKQMISAVESEARQLINLNHRYDIYKNQLLKQAYNQAEASLTAYTNDDGSFSDVVKAKIAELDAKLASLRIEVERTKTKARLGYYFMNQPTFKTLNKEGQE